MTSYGTKSLTSGCNTTGDVLLPGSSCGGTADSVTLRKATSSFEDYNSFNHVEFSCFGENYYSYYEYQSVVSQGLSYVAEKNNIMIGFLICAKSNLEDYIDSEEYEIIQALLRKHLPNRSNSRMSCLRSYSQDKYIHIFGFGVLPEFRNMGIGNLLMKQILTYQKKHKKPLLLEVRVDNENAIRLYTKLGFKKTVMLPDYYSDNEPGYIFLKLSF